MTTNYPNPVDGDVQAPIRNIQRRIKNTKRWLSANKSIGNPENEAVELILIYETALAALTAKPGIFEWRFKETDCAPATGWIAIPMEKIEQAKQTFGDLVEYRFWYSTPPAQILRPVELPDERVWDEDDESEDDSYNCGWNRCIKACAEALRQQGYEVKK